MLHAQVRKASPGAAALSEGEEMEIVVRAVCATKLPTLTFDDTKCVAARGLGRSAGPGPACWLGFQLECWLCCQCDGPCHGCEGAARVASGPAPTHFRQPCLPPAA